LRREEEEGREQRKGKERRERDTDEPRDYIYYVGILIDIIRNVL
jgi:hypothetical protein